MTTDFFAKEVDPLALPSLPLEWKAGLPRNCAGIYFVLSPEQEVLYIGQSTDIKKRWQGHQFFPKLQKMGGVRIAWLEVTDCIIMSAIEAALIEYFHPPFNIKPGDPNKPIKKREKAGVVIFCRLRILMADRRIPLNQRQVAKATGLSTTTINQLCNNNFSRVDADTIDKLCNFFKCEVGDLLALKKFEQGDPLPQDIPAQVNK